MVHMEMTVRHKPRRAKPKRLPDSVRLSKLGFCYNQQVEETEPRLGSPRRQGQIVGIDGYDRLKIFWDDQRSSGKRAAKSVDPKSVRPVRANGSTVFHL